MKHMDVKRLTRISMLVAMASAVHLLEYYLLPLFPAIPGAKLGLANAVTLYALMHQNPEDALCIGVLRCFIGLLITGAVTGFIYSIAGALCSFLGMLLFKRLKFPIFVISMMGALCHNTAQIGVGILLTKTAALIVYWPWLALIALPTGFFIALIDVFCHRAIERGTRHEG
jgi:heptaprenyl diphosphate synthase